MSVPVRISSTRARISARGVLASGAYRPGYPPRRSLLPSHARKREVAIGAADAAVGDLDVDLIRRVGGPDIDAVPAAYLPARAEMRSVDVWDPLWPDAVKRAVIKAAPGVHRRKGTVDAVKSALAALGINAVITEWWQTTPRGRPYTFSVQAIVTGRLYTGPLLDPRTVGVVYATVLRTKPVSRAFDLTLSAGMPGPLGLAPVLVPRFRIALAAAPVLPPGVVY